MKREKVYEQPSVEIELMEKPSVLMLSGREGLDTEFNYDSGDWL